MRRTQTSIFPNSSNYGFGIIELMVGLAIGMIVILVLMQVFASTEQWTRNTSSGSDTQTNTQLAAYVVTTSLANAGGSLISTRCNNDVIDKHSTYARVWIKNADKSDRFFLPTLPVIISSNGSYGDQIRFIEQRGLAGLGSQRLWQEVTSTNGPLVIRSFQGITNNRWVLVSKADSSEEAEHNFVTDGITYDCALAFITKIEQTADKLYAVSHEGLPEAMLPIGADTVAARIAVGIPSAHWIQGIGQLELQTIKVGKVDGEGPVGLIRSVSLINDPNSIINETIEAPDIVYLKAFYGFDNSETPTGSITHWLSANDCSTSDTGWECKGILNNSKARTSERLIAIRYGFVSRIPQHDKTIFGEDETPPSSLTLWNWDDVAPDTTNPGGSVSYDISSDDGEYRYRVMQAVVPLRSSIWNVNISQEAP